MSELHAAMRNAGWRRQEQKAFTCQCCGKLVTQRTSSFSGKCPECHAEFDGPIEQIVEHVKEHAEQEARDRLMAKKGAAMSELRLSAYYYSFEATGERVVDEILSAVAVAGKSYHHTEYWNETSFMVPDGKTHIEHIQWKAETAAQEITRLRNMNPAEFEDEWMRAHPFVCGPCERGDHGGNTNIGSLHRPATFEIETVARERRQRGECAGRNRSKIRGTTFYCSCEWRPEAK